MKKIISTIALALLAGYLVFATIVLCRKPEGQTCQGIKLEMQDSVNTGYMTTADIVKLLKDAKLDPTGKPLEEVSCRALEQELGKSPLISESECYKTISGYLVVKVKCRRPILRIISERGESYYIDEEGQIIERIAKAMYLPIATGHISREFARKELYPLALFLQENVFWEAQVEQIYVTSQKEIELTPRVGNHVIVLGRPGNYEYKFSQLKTFYEKGLCEVGWNRYSRINVGYGNQVIATKRPTKK